MTPAASRAGGEFTSALYLGLRHASGSLRAWDALTSGRPAALEAPSGERAVGAALARLVGVERGLLAPSTLHLAVDVFDLLVGARDGARDGAPVAVHVDAAVYPIARWGVERAACRGARVRRYAHLSAASAAAGVEASARAGLRPVVVTDGFCPGCGRAAPLAELQRLAASAGGVLVVDDTQALGVLGASPGPARPYGAGGGGTLRWSAAPADGVLVIASLAKAFGAPVAALLGDAELVSRFAAESATRVHCSPPSAAAIAAAARALAVNAVRGDALRARLAALVSRFRAGAERAGVPLGVGAFPAQAVMLSADDGDPRAVQARLRARGTTAVPTRAHGAPAARLTFLITAAHDGAAVDRAARDVAATLAERRHGVARARRTAAHSQSARQEAPCG